MTSENKIMAQVIKYFIYDSMAGPRPRGYLAKWNKSERERQIPYDFTYIQYLKAKQNK